MWLMFSLLNTGVLVIRETVAHSLKHVESDRSLETGITHSLGNTETVYTYEKVLSKLALYDYLVVKSLA